MSLAVNRFRAMAAMMLALVLLGVAPAAAQQLSPAMCPAGTVFKPRPFAFHQFPLPNPLVPPPGIPMLRRTIDTTIYPEALCNDGSPAVMYIRPANAAYAGNPVVNPSSQWLIFFDGGGGCRDADSCLLERWCGGGGRIFDQAGKMSSRAAPPAIREVGGIWTLSPPGVVNHFAQYNQVLVHYCSSDTWSGSAQWSGLTTSTGVPYDIRFEGEAIVNAVFDTLLAGPTSADAAPAGIFYNTTLPNLAGATQVVIGGESAGAGIRNHLDRLRDQLLAANPQIDVRAVLDAEYPPGWWESNISWAAANSPASYMDYLLLELEPVSRNFHGVEDSALDQSCLDPAFAAAHNAIITSSGAVVAGSHPQVCLDRQYVQANHITTPTFIRHDINDTLARERYQDWSAFANVADYWRAQYEQLGRVAGGGAGLEAPAAPSGVQATKCNKHVTIQTNPGFFRDLVAGPGLPPLSFHGLLVNWLTGVGPGSLTLQLQNDYNAGLRYTSSICY